MPKAAKTASDAAHKRPSKRVKPAPSPEERVRRLWRTILDELVGQQGHTFPHKALRNVERLLALQPDDDFAFLCRAQLLAAVDRFDDAHELLQPAAGADDPPKHPLELAYVLYKLKREAEALAVIKAARSSRLDDATARGLRILEAQLLYRLEDYSAAKDAYDELLLGVEPDAPEYDDLQTNLAACQAYLDFFASVPSRLEAMGHTLPSAAQLEAAPLDILVASNATTRPSASRAHPRPAFSAAFVADQAQRKPKRKARPPKHPRPTRLPPHIAALPADKRPAPDPERWLPKRERSGWAAQQTAMLAERERLRDVKRRKANAKQATQGAVEPAVAAGAAKRKKRGA